MNLGTKLNMAVVIILVMISLIGILIFSWQNEKLLSSHYIDEELINEMNSFSQIINIYLNRAKDGLSSIAKSSETITALEMENKNNLDLISQRLTEFKENNSIFYNIGLHKIEGNNCIVKAVDKGASAVIGQNFSERDYCKGSIKSDEIYISNSFISIIDRKAVIGITVPVKDKNGKKIGYVLGALNLGELRGYLWDLQKNSYLILLDRDGNKFLDTRQEIKEISQPKNEDEGIIQSLEEIKSGKMQGFFRYGNNFAGFRKSDFGEIIFSRSAEDMIQIINLNAFLVSFVVMIAIIIIIICLFIFTRIIVSNLIKLTNFAKEISQGNLQAILEEKILKSKDEIGVLAITFKEAVEKLKVLPIVLEKEVKERTKELLEAKVKDEALLSSIGDGMIAVDENARIIFMSKATEKILGWQFDEIKGKDLYEILPVFDEQEKPISKEKRPINIALNSGKDFTTTTTTNYFYSTKFGNRFPAAVTVAPIILEGKIIGAIDIFRDITEEKEIDKAKSEFVSLASHQLRTPLTSIRWLAEIFSKNEKLSDKGRDYLDNIMKSSKHLATLVELLLDVSRLEMGRMAVTPVSFDAVSFIKDYLETQMAPLASKKKINLSFSKHSETLMVFTDKVALFNIIHTIISNSLEYTPENGNVEISLEGDLATFLISVSDNGIGIPRKDQDKVSKKFVRASNASKMKADGVGLGLYIAYQTTNLLNGKIWFKSEEGKGTTFYVALPLRVKEKEGELKFQQRRDV